MGRGIAMQLQAVHGVEPTVIVNRTIERAVAVWLSLGVPRDEIVVSDDSRLIQIAVEQGLACVCRDVASVLPLREIEVLVEATGCVSAGARSALAAIGVGKHVVAVNAELDATLGCYLAERARQQGVVYGYGDGDQPGVLMRLLEWMDSLGFEVVAAVNCCEALDVRATPLGCGALAARMRTSPRVACSIMDGTRMNLVNAILANATGLTPEVRGMHGLRTTRKDAVRDFARVLGRTGVVDFVQGGDFGAGVFVIGRCNDRERVGHYFDYLRMGAGPDYLFFRPYHLCHLEVPFSVAEAVIYREPTLAPLGAPVADVVAIAKRDLKAGEVLDVIGGDTHYGRIDSVDSARELVPCGVATGAVLLRSVSADEPIPRSGVEFQNGDYILNMRRLQETLFSTLKPTPASVCA
jgi:predicted homoserine dehydrogenase-like protein